MSSVDSFLDDRIDSLFALRVIKGGALRIANRALVVVIAVLALYLAIEIVFIRPRADMPKGTEIQVRSGSPGSLGGAAGPSRDFSAYSKDIAGKGIFSAGSARSSGPVVSSEGASGGLGLMGVIGGDSPQAIIEDKASQKTYYAKKGESAGEYVVEDISDGVVVLDGPGGKLRLTL
jgi:hypothetical protein